jgi:hypothetical protein
LEYCIELSHDDARGEELIEAVANGGFTGALATQLQAYGMHVKATQLTAERCTTRPFRFCNLNLVWEFPKKKGQASGEKDYLDGSCLVYNQEVCEAVVDYRHTSYTPKSCDRNLSAAAAANAYQEESEGSGGGSDSATVSAGGSGSAGGSESADLKPATMPSVSVEGVHGADEEEYPEEEYLDMQTQTAVQGKVGLEQEDEMPLNCKGGGGENANADGGGDEAGGDDKDIPTTKGKNKMWPWYGKKGETAKEKTEGEVKGTGGEGGAVGKEGGGVGLQTNRSAAIEHSGDVMGKNSGKHVIKLDLPSIPSSVSDIFIVLSAYKVSRLQMNKMTHLYTFSNLCLPLCLLGSYSPVRRPIVLPSPHYPPL